MSDTYTETYNPYIDVCTEVVAATGSDLVLFFVLVVVVIIATAVPMYKLASERSQHKADVEKAKLKLLARTLDVHTESLIIVSGNAQRRKCCVYSPEVCNKQ
jgi:hypothetical protein